MTQSTKHTPADALPQARRADSETKRNNVFRTRHQTRRDGLENNFATVAHNATMRSGAMSRAAFQRSPKR